MTSTFFSRASQLFRKRPQEGPPFGFAMIWLIYMLFPLAAVADLSPAEQLIGFPLLAIFTACYIIGFLKSRLRAAMIVAHLMIIGYFIWRYDESYIYLMFYTVSLLGLLRAKIEIAFALSGVLLLFGIIVYRYEMTHSPSDILDLLPVVFAMLLLPGAIMITRRSRRLRAQLQLANDEIERLIQSEERQRISRELHDTLGHTLTMITLKSELAEKLIASQPERAKQEIRDVQSTSRAALKQVRELVSDMRAVTVRDEVSNAKRILAAASIGLRLEGSIAGMEINALLDNLLGMCLREAITNVVKHSRARRCSIAWEEQPGAYVLTVTDDGIGVGSPEELARAAANGHNGLKGMQERLNLMDGKLSVDSPKGQGTRVKITVPKIHTTAERGERK